MKKHKKLFNKILCVVIILLFVCVNISLSNAFDNLYKSSKLDFNGNILYVGGSGPGNYSKIEDAVENATDGDTVFVYDDSSPYKDVSLNINKSIKLQGENMTTTIIYCWGSISSDNVTITDFTFQDHGPAIEIEGSSNNIIENCAFNGSVAFLVLSKSNNNIIRNCSFSYLEFGALSIGYSDNNEISYCDFFNNQNWMMGTPVISVFGSRGIKIHHCNIAHNLNGGFSIQASSVQFNFNNIFDNSVDGYGMNIGFLSYCNLKNNWWGSSQGPNITLNGRFARKFIIRQVDYGDTVFFWGKPLIMQIIGVIWLLPWLTEPVVDTG